MMLSKWPSKLIDHIHSRSITTVTLYTKPDCTLCQPVRYIINKTKHKYKFHYIETNIDNDPLANQLYCNDIPVVHVNGVEIARHKLSECRLIDALNKYSNV